MNPRWKENPIFLQFLLGCLLFLFLTTLSFLISLVQPSIPGLTLFARANSTRTSIALTSRALMGPFPTPTGPTPTPSWTPSITPTPTLKPTNSPTPTPFRYFINTSTPRTALPRTNASPTAGPGPTRTSSPPTRQPRPTSTSVQATDPPQQPTNPPPQATNPPRKSTKTAKPPRSTKTPKKSVPLGDCIYLASCYDALPDYALRHQ